jgi:AraC-like DNA-binding protein
MIYRERPPDLRLARWVECSWTLQCDQPFPAYPVRPDGCLDLIYAPANGAQAVGAMTTERRFDLPARSPTLGIRFRPGMAGTFLGVAASELTDRTLALHDVWTRGARDLESRIGNARSLDAAVEILSGALRTPAGEPHGVQRAIAAIASAHGDIDLAWVARQAGLSARQFRRRCLEESGLTPKHLCRVLRFRRACALAISPADWAGIAAAAGYFDQSHLIRDFREFSGGTPMSVFSNTPNLPLR